MTKNLRQSFGILFFVLVTSPLASAQDLQVLGIDPLTSASYQCQRQGDPKFSQIYIVKKTGKTSNASLKKARRSIKKSQMLAKKRWKLVKKQQKQNKKKIAKLASKLLLSQQQEQTLKRLKQQRDIIEARLTELTGNIGALRELNDSLAGCFKPLKVSGNVEIFSGTYQRNNGDVYFYALLHVRWEQYLVNSGNVCAQVAGHSVPLANASGSYTLEAPAISSFNPSYNLCIHKIDGNIQNGCYVRYDGYMSPLAGMGGQQAPGTCGEAEERCSLAAALSILNARLSQITLSDVKICE